MAYAEKLGKGYRARYLKPDGTYGSEPGFQTKTAAKKWGAAEEDKIRRRGVVGCPGPGRDDDGELRNDPEQHDPAVPEGS
jgi:hypothetical protein